MEELQFYYQSSGPAYLAFSGPQHKPRQDCGLTLRPIGPETPRSADRSPTELRMCRGMQNLAPRVSPSCALPSPAATPAPSATLFPHRPPPRSRCPLHGEPRAALWFLVGVLLCVAPAPSPACAASLHRGSHPGVRRRPTRDHGGACPGGWRLADHPSPSLPAADLAVAMALSPASGPPPWSAARLAPTC